MKETEIAKALIRWLDSMGWEIFQEVQFEGAIADVVATYGRLVWVIEVKNGLTAAVVEQAANWLDFAHYVSVCTPQRRATRGRIVIQGYMHWKGIGWLIVHSVGSQWEGVSEPYGMKARFRRRVSDRMRSCLSDRHKTFAEAGNNEGKRWTPFQETSHRVREVVRRSPGCDLKFLVDSVVHHYASPQGFKVHVPKLIRQGVIKGIEIREDGRKLRFYPGEEQGDRSGKGGA